MQGFAPVEVPREWSKSADFILSLYSARETDCWTVFPELPKRLMLVLLRLVGAAAAAAAIAVRRQLYACPARGTGSQPCKPVSHLQLRFRSPSPVREDVENHSKSIKHLIRKDFCDGEHTSDHFQIAKRRAGQTRPVMSRSRPSKNLCVCKLGPFTIYIHSIPVFWHVVELKFQYPRSLPRTHFRRSFGLSWNRGDLPILRSSA